MNPLELLPPEIWQLIFEKVEDPQDWLNLYRASPSSFEAVVGGELPNALFPKVFPLMHQYLHPNNAIDNVLPLRLVSRKWKEVVDKAFTVDPLQWKVSTHYYYYYGSREISRFLNKFGTHPGNPLIGNVVRLDVSEDMEESEEENAEFRKLLERFMGRFGVHIINLSLEEIDRRSLDNLVIMLRSCLNSCPKLEGLTVHLYGEEGVDYPLEDPTLGNQLLPLISGLKSFSFANMSRTWRTSVTLQSIMVRMACHPDTLTKAELVGVPAELVSFPNLENVELDCRCDDDDDDGDCETNANVDIILSVLTSTSWPLSRLVLGLPESIVPLEHLIKCVEHFKDTLTFLEVYSSWKASPQDHLLRVNLPRLKYLEVRNTHVPFALLTNLKALEELRVGGLPSDHHIPFGDRQQLIAHVEATKREMLEFDVWNTLPKLREIQFSELYRIGRGGGIIYFQSIRNINFVAESEFGIPE